MALSTTNLLATLSQQARTDARTINTEGAVVGATQVVGALPNGSGGNMTGTQWDSSAAMGDLVEAIALATLKQLPGHVLDPALAVYRGVTPSSINNQVFAIGFPSVDYDPGGLVQNPGVAGSFRYIVPASGRYEVTASVLLFNGNATVVKAAEVSIDHISADPEALIGNHRLDSINHPFATCHLKGTTNIYAAAGSKLRAVLYCNAAMNISTQLGETYFFVKRVA